MLPIANGSFMEAQLQSIDDPSAVIHNGQHRAQSRHQYLIQSVQDVRARNESWRLYGRYQFSQHVSILRRAVGESFVARADDTFNAPLKVGEPR
jgi:hypothetical protein